MKRCIIIGASDFERFDFELTPGDFTVAADGGYKKCLELGIVPNIAVGDFDSLGFIPDFESKTVLPTEKDITDLYKAVEIGKENGCDEFHIFGGTGGRIDHTLANISIVAELSVNGIKSYLYSDCQIITAVTNGTLNFDKNEKGYISVFSFTDESIVNESGLKYSLDNYIMKNTFAIGVSNEFTGKESVIAVNKGTAVIIYEY